jgi:small subunit ribosomal protein S21
MIIIDARKEKGGIESALKVLKNKVLKTGLITELKNRKEYVKPSVRKRTKKQKAAYGQKIKNGLN